MTLLHTIHSGNSNSATPKNVEHLDIIPGVADRLHLWPDKSLGNVGVADRMPKPREYLRWLRKSWACISECPRLAP